MSKMFDVVTKVWNPQIGCLYDCTYCWARDLALGRLKHLPRYRDGFNPQYIEGELGKTFKSGFIFVSTMGDLWGSWVPDSSIIRVLDVVEASPKATFLFLTKNPARYRGFLLWMPYNVILGATIEGTIPLGSYWSISGAPLPMERLEAMARIPNTFRKMVSIEPILDFQPQRFEVALRAIHPEIVYVGYDNYGHQLSEPSLEATEALIAQLETFTEVREKTIRRAWWEEIGN